MSRHKALDDLFYRTNPGSVARQRFRPLIWDPFYLQLSFLKRTFRQVAASGTIRSVLDLGCGGMHYRRFLEGREIQYLGVDDHGGDPMILKRDLEEDFSLGSFDLIICSEVLEHIFNTRRLIDNIFRHLAPGGVLFVSVPFAYEVHGWAYRDYFRFTDQALRLLLAGHGDVRLQPTNSYLSSIVQRFNNLVYYVPAPHFLKLPAFLLLNLVMMGTEKVVNGFLRAFRIGPDTLFHRLVYSFPLGYVCVVGSGYQEVTRAAGPGGSGGGPEDSAGAGTDATTGGRR